MKISPDTKHVLVWSGAAERVLTPSDTDLSGEWVKCQVSRSGSGSPWTGCRASWSPSSRASPSSVSGSSSLWPGVTLQGGQVGQLIWNSKFCLSNMFIVYACNLRYFMYLLTLFLAPLGAQKVTESYRRCLKYFVLLKEENPLKNSHNPLLWIRLWEMESWSKKKRRN